MAAKNKHLGSSFGAVADDDEGGIGSQEEVYGGREEALGGEESRGSVGEGGEVGQSTSSEDSSEVEREGRSSKADRAEKRSQLEEEEEDAKLQRRGWLPSDDPVVPDAESVVEFGYVGLCSVCLLDSCANIPMALTSCFEIRVRALPILSARPRVVREGLAERLFSGGEGEVESLSFALDADRL